MEPMSEKHKSALLKNRVSLRDNLDMDKIMSHLLQYQIVSQLEHDSLLTVPENHKRVERFLDMLRKKADWTYGKFVYILELPDVDCQYLANQLHSGDSNRKMSDEHKRTILDNKEPLVKDLDIDKALDYLSAHKVLDENDIERIKRKLDEGNKERAREFLINIIMGKEDWAFDVFVKALEVFQPHPADLLAGRRSPPEQEAYNLR